MQAVTSLTYKPTAQPDLAQVTPEMERVARKEYSHREAIDGLKGCAVGTAVFVAGIAISLFTGKHLHRTGRKLAAVLVMVLGSGLGGGGMGFLTGILVAVLPHGANINIRDRNQTAIRAVRDGTKSVSDVWTDLTDKVKAAWLPKVEPLELLEMKKSGVLSASEQDRLSKMGDNWAYQGLKELRELSAKDVVSQLSNISFSSWIKACPSRFALVINALTHKQKRTPSIQAALKPLFEAAVENGVWEEFIATIPFNDLKTQGDEKTLITLDGEELWVSNDVMTEYDAFGWIDVGAEWIGEEYIENKQAFKQFLLVAHNPDHLPEFKNFNEFNAFITEIDKYGGKELSPQLIEHLDEQYATRFRGQQIKLDLVMKLNLQRTIDLISKPVTFDTCEQFFRGLSGRGSERFSDVILLMHGEEQQMTKESISAKWAHACQHKLSWLKEVCKRACKNDPELLKGWPMGQTPQELSDLIEGRRAFDSYFVKHSL